MTRYLLTLFFIIISASPIFAAQKKEIFLVQCRETAIEKEGRWVKIELYFGLSSVSGGVSEQEWQQFLKDEISTRFPEGLTTLEGEGQYLSSGGITVQEKTKIVILIARDEKLNYQKVEEIIEAFKKSFQQESVLKVIVPAQAGF